MRQKKTIVLVLHGFPGLTSDDPILSYLKHDNFEIVLPNLFEENIIFDKNGLVKIIKSSLKNKTPDVIIAASLGGLIAPIIARSYPKSKMVLIATAPRVETKIKAYNMLVRNGNKYIFSLAQKIVRLMPVNISIFIYKMFNPNRSSIPTSVNFEEHIKEVLILTKKISARKLTEIAYFVRNLNNTDIWKKTTNKTLIIGSNNDVIMPFKLSEELNSLIQGSLLLANNNRIHHNVFDERDFGNVDRFLGMS